jgi:hypothetical protein
VVVATTDRNGVRPSGPLADPKTGAKEIFVKDKDGWFRWDATAGDWETEKMSPADVQTYVGTADVDTGGQS